MREIYVDIWNDIRVFIIIIWRSKKNDPVGMVGCSYYAIAIFVRETWYSMNKCLRRFLNENNIKVFKMLSIKVLFLQTFYKKILRFFKVILGYYLWLNKVICFWNPKVLDISSYITFYWSNASRIGKSLSQLDNYL